MIRLNTILAAGAAITLLAGCAGLEVQTAEKTQPTGDAFPTAPYKGYLRRPGPLGIRFHSDPVSDGDQFVPSLLKEMLRPVRA